MHVSAPLVTEENCFSHLVQASRSPGAETTCRLLTLVIRVQYGKVPFITLVYTRPLVRSDPYSLRNSQTAHTETLNSHILIRKMRALILILAALLLRHAHGDFLVPDELQPIRIFSQPVAQSLSHTNISPLASIEYNISNHESRLLSYSPPVISNTKNEPLISHPLFRISTDSMDGSTMVTSLSTFNPAYAQTLTLHLRDDGLVFAASFSADPLTPPSTSNIPAPNLEVILLAPKPGPAPKLNIRKPVAVGADGKEMPQAPEVEKSFFQKYWWAFALVAVLALAGGGDK